MGKKHTIVINGRTYDAVSGLALSEKKEKGANHVVKQTKNISVKSPSKLQQDIASAPSRTTAKAIHRQTQRSHTLKRTGVKKPVIDNRRKITVTNTGHKHTPRSERISKFAKHPEGVTKKATTSISPALPPAKKHTSSVANKKSTQPISSKAIKEQLIRQQLNSTPTARVVIEKVHKTKPVRDDGPSKLRAASVITVCFTLLVLAGYLTYLSMPNLSIKIAAMQTGVNAKLPEYKPQGYQLNGPAAYTDGKVKVGYKSFFGNQEYSITQTSSEWDSQATLDNFVAKDSKDDYQTRSTQGLTIYT